MRKLPDERFITADIRIADGTAVVRFRGDLDITVAHALGQQLGELAEKKPDRLVFDMAAVSFLDCAAAGVILRASRSILPAGKPVIRAAAPLVRRLLEVAGLDTQCELASREVSPLRRRLRSGRVHGRRTAADG